MPLLLIHVKQSILISLPLRFSPIKNLFGVHKRRSLTKTADLKSKDARKQSETETHRGGLWHLGTLVGIRTQSGFSHFIRVLVKCGLNTLVTVHA